MKTNSRISGLNIRFKLFLIFSIFIVLSMGAFSKTVSTGSIRSANVLKGGVSVGQALPSEFYGTWSVISVLMETNNPELFKKKSSDIWTLERNADIITLTNPVNGVTASITVNEVRNNTAIFTRIKKDENEVQIETPEITVEGDRFYGTDTIIMQELNNGKIVSTNVVKYKVVGQRIGKTEWKINMM